MSALLLVIILLIIVAVCCCKNKNELKKVDIFCENVETERSNSLFDDNGMPNENRKYTVGGTP